MLIKMIESILDYFGFFNQPEPPVTLQDEAQSEEPTPAEPPVQPTQQGPIEAPESIIAAAFYNQALARRKEAVDEKTQAELKNRSETLAAQMPTELQQLIGERYLIQFKKKEAVEKRRERKRNLEEKRRNIEKLIADGLLPPLRRGERIQDIDIRYGFQEGFYYKNYATNGFRGYRVTSTYR